MRLLCLSFFNDIWINIETADLETPPIGWIPKDKKYRFEWEIGD